jgi:hypothetical protein
MTGPRDLLVGSREHSAFKTGGETFLFQGRTLYA